MPVPRDQVWAQLGKALRSDRERQGLTREQVALRVAGRGGQVSARTIGTLERGVAPKKRDKPPSLEPVAAAIGWPAGAVDRILAGEDPRAVLVPVEEATARGGVALVPLARDEILAMLPSIYAFSRGVVALGGSALLGDEFNALAARLVATLPAKDRAAYGLAAYRPHGEGEPLPPDDAERVLRAMDRGE